MSFSFFHQIDYCRQVVTIAIEPHATSMCSLDIAFVLSLRLEQIVPAEYLILSEFQCIIVLLAFLMQQIVVHDNLVEQVPGSIIHQRTRSRVWRPGTRTSNGHADRRSYRP